MEPRRCTATHSLDGISWQHVSNSNVAPEVHSHSHSRWGESFVLSIWNFHITCILPPIPLHSQNAFLSLWNSYIFPLIICIINILSNELDGTPTYWISMLNLVTNIGSWYLHPEMSVVTVFPGSGGSALSHDPSQLESQLQKMYSTYIPQYSNVRTKMQSCQSNPPLFIWVLISQQFEQKCTIVEAPNIYLKYRDKLKQHRTSGRQTGSPHIQCRPLGYSVGRWRTTSSVPSRWSMPPSVWLVPQLVSDDYLHPGQ